MDLVILLLFLVILLLYIVAVYLQLDKLKPIYIFIYNNDYSELDQYLNQIKGIDKHAKRFYSIFCAFALNQPARFYSLYTNTILKSKYQVLICAMKICVDFICSRANVFPRDYEFFRFQISKVKKKSSYLLSFCDIIEMIHLFYDRQYDSIIKIYNDKLSIWEFDSGWAIATFVYCKALEQKGDREEFAKAVSEAEIRLKDNRYMGLYNEWL